MGKKGLRRFTIGALLMLGSISTAASTSSAGDNVGISDQDDVVTITPSPSAASIMMTASPTSVTSPTPSPVAAQTPAPASANSDAAPTSGSDTPSLNDPIPKPECNASIPVTMRYSSTTKRLYLEKLENGTRGGCVMLEQIWMARGGGEPEGVKAPLYAVDSDGAVSANATGIWLLTEDLYVKDGITLKLWGSVAGGDTDELRLKSAPAVDGGNATVINLRGHGGNIDILHTKVVSWDTEANDYDMNESDGRSYISVVSEKLSDPVQTCDGNAKNEMGEARMDIVSSEVGYLGYKNSESYGLTWKVRGFCKDKSNPEIFDDVNVYGNIYDSEIHHNHYGMYTFGHERGDWRRNMMHSNTGYGFDPHDDSDFLTIHDNTVYDNGWHGIIASKRCNNVSIQGNEVYGGGDTSAGIFLHRSSDFAVVKDNYCHHNGDAGMAMLESSDSLISDNVFEANKYGVRMSVGCTNNTVSNNAFSDTLQYALYTYEGSDAPDVQPTGYSQNNVWKANSITGGPQPMKFKESDGNQLIDNVFTNPGIMEFASTTDNVVTGNIGFDEATEIKVSAPVCFISTDEASLVTQEVLDACTE
ncbi:unnamed protein product [Pylaiella littoralis]